MHSRPWAPLTPNSWTISNKETFVKDTQIFDAMFNVFFVVAPFDNHGIYSFITKPKYILLHGDYNANTVTSQPY